MSCACLAPAKRVWRGLRLRRTTTGNGSLGRLRKEVRACEYSDVHVMWDMLGGTGTGTGVRDGRWPRPTAAGSNGGAIGPGRVGRKLTAWSPTAARSEV